MNFYDDLAPFYHLVFSDWEEGIEAGARRLDEIIRESCLNEAKRVLDVSCGIGTQALGLARLGYAVTASDISPGAVDRARSEADRRELRIDFAVADMREAYDHHRKPFDVVVSFHNSVTHLPTEEDISLAFEQFKKCLVPGGICVINVRDYDAEERGIGMIKPFGVRTENDTRYVVFQVWDFEGDVCDVSLYFVREEERGECRTHVFRTRYYATGIDSLMRLLSQAGFSKVRRLDNPFEGPIVVAVKPDE